MKKFLLAFVLLCSVSSVSFADSPSIPTTALPDTKETPGWVRTTDIHDDYVCGKTKETRKSTSEIRIQLTQKLKDNAYVRYHLKSKTDAQCNGVKQHCEVDHLVSLELGGDPKDPRNIWVQPFEGLWNAHDKDKLENELHRRVCAGTMDLVAAQTAIKTNWIKTYQDTFNTLVPLHIGK